MLPKGGELIWGNSIGAPEGGALKGNIISFAPEEREEALEDEILRAELEKDGLFADTINMTNPADEGTTDGTNAGEAHLRRLKTRRFLKKYGKKKQSPSHVLVRNVTMSDAIEWMLKVAEDPQFERYIR